MSKYLPFVFSVVFVIMMVSSAVVVYYFFQRNQSSSFNTSTRRLQDLPASSVNAPPLTEKNATIDRVENNSITVTLNDGKMYSYLFSNPRIYVVYKKKPGVKAALANLAAGQTVTLTTEKDELGIEVIKTIVIDD